MPVATGPSTRTRGLGGLAAVTIAAVFFVVATNGDPSTGKSPDADEPIAAVFTVTVKAPEFLERPDARGSISYSVGPQFGSHEITAADQLRRVPGKFSWSTTESVQRGQKLGLHALITNAGKLSRNDLSCRIDLTTRSGPIEARPVIRPFASPTSRSGRATLTVP